MNNYEYSNFEEAIKVKEAVQKEINSFLEKDLGLLDEGERTIGRWFGLLGKLPEYEQRALELDKLQMILLDVEKYIHDRKTIMDLD